MAIEQDQAEEFTDIILEYVEQNNWSETDIAEYCGILMCATAKSIDLPIEIFECTCDSIKKLYRKFPKE